MSTKPTSRGGRPTRTHPLPDHPGNAPIPFQTLMSLTRLSPTTYRSLTPAFSPGGPVGPGRTYGGHVYAQAAWAASQTVGPSFHIHSMSGNFLIGGDPDRAFTYEVAVVRDGRSYCTRTVDVTQRDGEGVCFTSIVSFKAPEEAQVDVQRMGDEYVRREYASVLDGRAVEEFPECPGMDVPFYWERRRATGLNDEFPGLECRRVDMERYNGDVGSGRRQGRGSRRARHPWDRRQLIFYRALGEMPAHEPNLHLCAHLYASDRNSLYSVTDAFELGDSFSAMSSLMHTVIFHGPIEDLMFFGHAGGVESETGTPGKWVCMEMCASRLSSGRATYHCRALNARGVHIMTAMQDGLVRFAANPSSPTEEERKIISDANDRWKTKKDREKL